MCYVLYIMNHVLCDMCYVSCITVSWNLRHITNNKTHLYNTNNKTNKQQDLPLQHKQQDLPLQHKQQDKQTTRLTFTTQTTRQTNNKTHEHQDKENDTKTSTHKTNKLETTIRHMNIKTKSTIPRQTHTKQKNSHLVSRDFTHRMISKSQQKVRLTSNLNSNTYISKLLTTTHLT